MTHQASALIAYKEPRLFEGTAAGRRLPNNTTHTEANAATCLLWYVLNSIQLPVHIQVKTDWAVHRDWPVKVYAGMAILSISGAF